MRRSGSGMASHRQDWLSPEANLEFAEILLAMSSPNAVCKRKPYMLLKLCVPAARFVAVTFQCTLFNIHAC